MSRWKQISTRALEILREIDRAGGELTFWSMRVKLSAPEGLASKGLLEFIPADKRPDGKVRWRLTPAGRAAIAEAA